MEAITVNELFAACREQLKKGNGNRKVLISSDDEGNEFHKCFFLFGKDIKGKDIEYGLRDMTADEFDRGYILLG